MVEFMDSHFDQLLVRFNSGTAWVIIKTKAINARDIHELFQSEIQDAFDLAADEN